MRRIAKASRLLFLDESGVNLSMAREYAWAPSNERAVGFVPKNWGQSMTVAAALSPDGIIAPLLLEGSMNGPTFHAYVEQFLAPELRSGDLVIMDNLGAHKPLGIRALIEATGARLLFLPPYSPDFSPIELAWSKMKAILRKLAARTRGQLLPAVARALRAISPEDARGWFGHCGYAVP